MFDIEDLKALVHDASAALSDEDRLMAECFGQRGILYGRTYPPGLLWLNNERYFQFMIARHLIAHSDYRIAIEAERKRFDLVLYRDEGPGVAPVAIGEIKRWMTNTGNTELPKIKRDLAKLSGNACPGFLLVISANPSTETDQNVRILSQELGLEKSQFAVRSFRTHGRNGKSRDWSECEVWILGTLCPQTG